MLKQVREGLRGRDWNVGFLESRGEGRRLPCGAEQARIRVPCLMGAVLFPRLFSQGSEHALEPNIGTGM